jgi:hypothetical protein
MLDMDAVAADMVGCSELGRDGVRRMRTPTEGADEEGVSNAAQQEPGGAGRGLEVTDDDSKEVDDDTFVSSSEESDAAEEVSAARVKWIMGRALSLCQIAVLEASAVAAPAREDGVNAQGRPQRMRTLANYSKEVQAQRWTS